MDLGGEVQTVYAQTANYLQDIEGEDFGAILLPLCQRRHRHCRGQRPVYPPIWKETLSIFGEEGTVCLGGLAVNRVEVWKVKDEERVVKGNEPDPDTVYGDGHISFNGTFSKQLLMAGSRHLWSGREKGRGDNPGCI